MTDKQENDLMPSRWYLEITTDHLLVSTGSPITAWPSGMMENAVNEWNNAYCWKLLAEKEAEIEGLEVRRETLNLTIEAKDLKNQQQAEVIRIAREHLEKIAEASISHRLMPFAAQQALDKMNRVEGK